MAKLWPGLISLIELFILIIQLDEHSTEAKTKQFYSLTFVLLHVQSVSHVIRFISAH